MKTNNTVFRAMAWLAIFAGAIVCQPAHRQNVKQQGRPPATLMLEQADGAVPPPTLPTPKVKGAGTLVADGAVSPPKLPAKPGPALV